MYVILLELLHSDCPHLRLISLLKLTRRCYFTLSLSFSDFINLAETEQNNYLEQPKGLKEILVLLNVTYA